MAWLLKGAHQKQYASAAHLNSAVIKGQQQLELGSLFYWLSSHTVRWAAAYKRAFWKWGTEKQQRGATRVSTDIVELEAFREAGGGAEDRCEDTPRYMKGLVDHSLWDDWMQRRRPLAGQNKDGLDCGKRPPGKTPSGLGGHPQKPMFIHSLALLN